MPSIFPDGFDSDLEIPRIDQNVSEVSGDTINSLRDAIFAMQKAIGLNGQGNKPSLVERINVAIDPNGNIKKSALEAVGLVTLPITNKQVGDTAGIVESKLKLDHPTQVLRNLIESLRIDLNGATSGLASTVSGFNIHILGAGNFHDGYHIKVNNPNTTQVGVAGLEALTIGDAVNELAAILITGNETTISHMDPGIPASVKHRASSISVDPTNFTSIDRAAINVQSALDSIDEEAGALGRRHTDSLHANGILKEINSGDLFNPNQKILGPTAGASYIEGTSIIKIPGVTTFAELNVRPGDILEIAEQTGIADVGTYQIRATGPLSAGAGLGNLPTLAEDELAIFHTFVESRVAADSVAVSVYKPASVPSEAAPLACSVRNNETIVDTITVLNPDAARVVSIGFNNSILNTDGYEIAIEAGIGNGVVRSLVIPSLHLDRLTTGQAQPVSASSVAERINAYVSDPDLGHHFPISAYRIGNEIAIAHNWVGQDYTLKIADGYTGNFALGLDAYGANVLDHTIVGNTNNAYVVNGVERSSVAEIFDGYAEITSSTSTFVLWNNNGQMINPLRYGLGPGAVMHVTGHPSVDANGSYTLFGANSSTVSLFASEPMAAPANPTRFNVRFTYSDISLDVLESTELDKGILQIYIDQNGKTLLHQRIRYGDNLGSAVEIVDASDNFPVGDILFSIGLDGENRIFTLIDDALPGETVTIPDYFEGKFKLYHPNNIDYLVIKVIDGPIPGAIEIVTVDPPLVLDEALKLCNVHFNGELVVTEVTDTRLFGNLSTAQIRDDFIEIFSQRPVEELRSDGVARGFDLMDIPYLDELSQMPALPLRGGTAYVNGVRVVTETQKVVIPSYDEEGVLVNGARRIIGINEFGTLQAYSDELGELLSDGYVSDVRFGRILPLYRVEITNGGISDVVDIRLFINNVDEKIDIIVDETNNVVGNFRSLDGALLYAENYPGAEKLTVRIMNTVTPNGQIIVPKGVSLLGNSPYGGDSKHQIIADTSFGTKFITLQGDNRLENLEIRSTQATYNESMVFINGSNVKVESCFIHYEGTIGTNNGDKAIEIGIAADEKIRIVNNKINNVFTGIEGLYGTEGIFIVNNEITELAGTGGISTGIAFGSSARVVDSAVIRDNVIKVPNLASLSDVRGITVDVGNEIKLLRLDSNYVLHDDNTEMTNGIRVENASSTGAKIKQLYVTDNYIKGIKLDDNAVYGIYVSNVDEVFVDRNKLQSIGTDGTNNNDVVVIKLATDILNATVTNNILKECDCTTGIQLEYGDGYATTGRAIVSGNILRNMGTSAWHITTNVVNTNINGNTLTGPSLQGIRVTGTRSIVSGNLLTKPNDGSGTDYAFSDRAIHIQTSDVDVVNNTITGMEYSQLSIGITNVNTSRERIKINGNTISGNKMGQLIQLYGAGHVVTNNRLYNTNKADGTDTFYIELNTVSNTLISGNVFQGEGTRCITNRRRGTSTDTVISNVTVVNNDISVSFSGNTPFGPILLQDDSGNASTVTQCLVANNRAPLTTGSVNRIGITAPTFGVYNTNVVGINIGISDVVSIPFNMATTAYDENASTSGLEHPHWVIEDTNNYWHVNSVSSADPRKLYIPIMGPPNGAKLLGVRITGTYDSTGSSTLIAEVFKKSSKQAGFTVTSISPQEDLTSTTFGQPGGVGDFELDSEEVVNYAESSYFVEITSTGAVTDGTGEGIQIHGLVVSYRY